MKTKFTGYTPVKARDKVNLIDNEGVTYHTATVVDALARQFTIKVKGKVRFFFYEDKGVTWERT